MKGFLPTKRSYLNAQAAAMKRQDREAARIIYRELAQKAYAFFLSRVGQQSQAEDLTQETFMTVIRALDSFDERRGDFTVWFWQIARNKLIDFFRSQKNSVISLDEELQIPTEHNTEQMVHHALLREKISAQLAGYDPRDQELFRLRFFAGLPYKDIARIAGKTEGAMRLKINRMQREIKKQLHEA